MNAILLRAAYMPDKWRLLIVSPWVRQTSFSLAALATLGTVIGLFVKPHPPQRQSVLILGILFVWLAAFAAPVWNRHVVRRLFDLFMPNDERSRRSFYALFELFFLLLLPYIMVVLCYQVWRGEA
jgi:hypothetical protein